jgi:hypothetical protein
VPTERRPSPSRRPAVVDACPSRVPCARPDGCRNLPGGLPFRRPFRLRPVLPLAPVRRPLSELPVHHRPQARPSLVHPPSRSVATPPSTASSQRYVLLVRRATDPRFLCSSRYRRRFVPHAPSSARPPCMPLRLSPLSLTTNDPMPLLRLQLDPLPRRAHHSAVASTPAVCQRQTRGVTSSGRPSDDVGAFARPFVRDVGSTGRASAASPALLGDTRSSLSCRRPVAVVDPGPPPSTVHPRQ